MSARIGCTCNGSGEDGCAIDPAGLSVGHVPGVGWIVAIAQGCIVGIAYCVWQIRTLAGGSPELVAWLLGFFVFVAFIGWRWSAELAKRPPNQSTAVAAQDARTIALARSIAIGTITTAAQARGINPSVSEMAEMTAALDAELARLNRAGAR